MTHLPIRRTPADDSGSLAFALLFILISVSLSALLAPVVVTQIGATRHEIQRAQALHAAMAGIDAGLGRIRAALGSDGATGDLTKLPTCGSAFSGDTGAGPSRYRVAVYYLDVDPRGQSEQWAKDHAVCSTGTPTRTPEYALLVATGTATATGAFTAIPTRLLHATYTFRTSGQPAPGGLIRVLRSSPYVPPLCLDAGPPPWSAGLYLTMQRCVRGSLRQTFAYNRNLTLLLVPSKTAALPYGLCVDGGSPHATGNPIRLQECQATAPARHQWSYTGSANFEGTTDGSSLDGFCLNVQYPGVQGSRLILGHENDGNCGDPYSPRQSFAPFPRVGAGMANPPNTTGQLVNFQQFGRCMDVPNGRNSLGHLIAWPCKQAPDGTYVGWNQVWELPTLTNNTATCGSGAVPCGKGTIRVTAPTGKSTPAGTYCMRSPGSTAAGQYVDILDTCPAGTPPANMTWTVYGDTDNALTRYHIVDYRGNCLAPSLTDFYTAGEQVSKIVLVPCADADLQMWNAPADARDPSPLKDIYER